MYKSDEKYLSKHASFRLSSFIYCVILKVATAYDTVVNGVAGPQSVMEKYELTL
jgi:hypothetical protein